MVDRERAAEVLDFELLLQSAEIPILPLLVQLGGRADKSFRVFFPPTLLAILKIQNFRWLLSLALTAAFFDSLLASGKNELPRSAVAVRDGPGTD
jgi:hypothetical protein